MAPLGGKWEMVDTTWESGEAQLAGLCVSPMEALNAITSKSTTAISCPQGSLVSLLVATCLPNHGSCNIIICICPSAI